MATDRLINKDQGDSMISALGTIATNINTITYGPQTSADKVVSMTGYAKAETAAAISQGDTLNEAVGKLEKKVDDNATAIDGKTAGPESATVGDLATFNNVNGKVLNDSGISIQTSVDTTKDTEVPTSKAVDTYVTGKGYAVGVANSTANHLVTFNGTDGKALKDGGATIAFNATGVLDDDTAIPTSKAVQSYVTGKHYAGSSSDGGAATSADKLNIGSSNIGSATQPVYFDKTTGKPVAITNTIRSNVPADAVFTDTTYTVAEGTANGKIKVTPSSGTAYEVPVHGLGNAAYKGVADTVSTSTDLVTSAAVNTKLASYVPNSDLIGIVNNGAKNIIFYENFPKTQAGMTFSIDVDGGLIVNGTCSVSGDTSAWIYGMYAYVEQGVEYSLIDTANGAEGGAYAYAFVADTDIFGDARTLYNYETHYTAAITKKATIALRLTNGITYTNKKFKCMICTKSQYDISDKYEPYALGNQVLTPELIELVDSGAKNLLTKDSMSASGNWVAKFALANSLSAGTYVFIANATFSESGKTNCGFKLYTSTSSDTAIVDVPTTYSNGKVMCEFILTHTVGALSIWTQSSTAAFTNCMICTKAAFAVSPKFVPYAKSNYSLTQLTSGLLATSYNTVSAVGNYISDIEGGYVKIGNLVVVNIRCTVANATPGSWTVVLAGLPYTLIQYGQGSSGAPLSNNKGADMAITGAGTIASATALATGTLLISGVYIAK